jgi:phage terminase small subunit
MAAAELDFLGKIFSRNTSPPTVKWTASHRPRLPVFPRRTACEASPEIEPPHPATARAACLLERVCRRRVAPGLLTAIDINPLAAYCVAYKRWRTAEEALAAMVERDVVTNSLLIKSADGNRAKIH